MFLNQMNKFLFISFIFLYSCDECETYTYRTNTDYSINVTDTTPNGIDVDTTGQDIDLERIDRIFNYVYDCIRNSFPDMIITGDVLEQGYCQNSEIIKENVCKRCMIIKIPDNWIMSKDGKEQMLQDEAPAQGCIDKGLCEDYNDCPCHWRALVNQDNKIVVTPNLRLLNDALLRYITSCWYVWENPILTECLKEVL